MSWDPVWEKVFRERTAWGKYPPEEVVRFIARSYYDVTDRSKVKVLELGCGPGAGTAWFIAREGYSYSGIDGSAVAIEKTRERFAADGLTGELLVGDITDLPWPAETFDCVVDIACLTCNTEIETREILNEVHRVLKSDGRHFSLTFKDGCWGDGDGRRLDASTWTEIAEGPFAGLGKTRFSSRHGLERLYAGFRDLDLDYVVRSVHGGQHEIAQWLVSCRK